MPERLPNLRHLQVLCEVARHGSVSAAARALHLSQPAATQAVARLESVLDARLFERTPGGVRATAHGRICVDRAGRVLERITDGVAGSARVRSHQEAERLLRMITSAELEAVTAVVEHNGFASAASAIGLSRPTLHRAVRRLEKTLGVPLFEWTSFGLSPTREAEHLACQARLACGEIQQALAEIRAAKDTDTGRTVIGAMPLARSGLVPRAVLEFTAQYPGHRISILDGPYENMLQELRHGGADALVGALRDPLPSPDIDQEHLFDDPLAVIMRAGHPLADRTTASVRLLCRFPWIAPRLGSPLRGQFEDLLRGGGSASEVPPVPFVECNSLVAARTMLMESDRLMLLSRYQIQHELSSGALIALPHPQGRVVRRIGLTLRKGWQPTTAQRALLQALRKHARAAARALA